MATFDGTIKIVTSGTYDGGPDLGTLKQSMVNAFPNAFTNGTGADNANAAFLDTRTVTASSSEELDLAGGLTDPFGTTLTFTRIKGLIISAAAANTNNVLVGGAASNAVSTIFSDTSDEIVVRPGGMFCITAPDATGMAVTASTADLLRIENSSSGTSVTYDIIIVGTV